MEDCIFCKIIRGEIPCDKVLENVNFLAFLDNRPFTNGHTLVVPKKHYRWVYDIENFEDYWSFTRQVTLKLKSSLNPEFITYFTMGNEVPHAHVHVIPRYPNDVLVGLFAESLRSSLSP